MHIVKDHISHVTFMSLLSLKLFMLNGYILTLGLHCVIIEMNKLVNQLLPYFWLIPNFPNIYWIDLFWSGDTVLPWGAITSYCRLDGLNNKHYFSQFWRLRSQRSRCWQIWCLVRTPSWFADGCLLVVFSHARKTELWSLHLLIRSPVP